MRDRIDGGGGAATLTPGYLSCQPPRGAQQELAVLWRAFAIQPQDGKLVAGVRLARADLVAPVHQLLDADAQ